MHNRVTIIMPVSREEHLDRLFASLELLNCDSSRTNLFVYVDGNARLFVKTRNFVNLSKFSQKLCIQRLRSQPISKYNLPGRKRRITRLMNEMKKYIQDCDYIFGIEDDTIVPVNSLKTLLRDYSQLPYAGFIEGVELGRWGIPYIGAWRMDDVYEPTQITSIPKEEGIREIDAGGLYCYLTKRDNFMDHDFRTFGDDDLGPDVEFGISLRQMGLNNYIDFSILCEHRTDKDKSITLANTTPVQVEFTRHQMKMPLQGNMPHYWEHKTIGE